MTALTSVTDNRLTEWRGAAYTAPLVRPNAPSPCRFSVPVFRNTTVWQPEHLEVTEPWRWQRPGKSTVLILEHQIGWIRLLYDVRTPVQVTMFLEANPFLVPLLFEVYGKIGQYFGPSPRVALEVVFDPEADHDVDLFALIQTHANPKEALACLDRLDEEWWLDALSRAQCKMTLDVEYC